MNRTLQPEIQELVQFNILPPVRTVMPNGVPLTIINAGEQDVVRVDILFGGGRWQQSQKLQALFANRMLREGSRKYTAAEIAEKLDYYGAWLELSSSAEYQVNASKVDFLAHRSLLRALYGEEHPCGRYVEETDYHHITPALLREFYDAYYHSGNCYVYLSGKVTDEITHRIEAAFGTTHFGNHQQVAVKKDFTFVSIPEKRLFIERDAECSKAGYNYYYEDTSGLSETPGTDHSVRRIFWKQTDV